MVGECREVALMRAFGLGCTWPIPARPFYVRFRFVRPRGPYSRSLKLHWAAGRLSRLLPVPARQWAALISSLLKVCFSDVVNGIAGRVIFCGKISRRFAVLWIARFKQPKLKQCVGQ